METAETIISLLVSMSLLILILTIFNLREKWWLAVKGIAALFTKTILGARKFTRKSKATESLITQEGVDALAALGSVAPAAQNASISMRDVATAMRALGQAGIHTEHFDCDALVNGLAIEAGRRRQFREDNNPDRDPERWSRFDSVLRGQPLTNSQLTTTDGATRAAINDDGGIEVGADVENVVRSHVGSEESIDEEAPESLPSSGVGETRLYAGKPIRLIRVKCKEEIK